MLPSNILLITTYTVFPLCIIVIIGYIVDLSIGKIVCKLI